MQQPREHVGAELNVLCDKCSVMDGGGVWKSGKKNVKCGENEERQLCQMRHTSKLFFHSPWRRRCETLCVRYSRLRLPEHSGLPGRVVKDNGGTAAPSAPLIPLLAKTPPKTLNSHLRRRARSNGCPTVFNKHVETHRGEAGRKRKKFLFKENHRNLFSGN